MAVPSHFLDASTVSLTGLYKIKEKCFFIMMSALLKEPAISDIWDTLVRLRLESYPSYKSPDRQIFSTIILLADRSPTDHIRTESIVATVIRNQLPRVPEELRPVWIIKKNI